MQKIYIKNFGPINEAEIDIDKALLLIGEQASGKSTTAKLIYFFRSLTDTLWRVTIEEQQPRKIIDLFKEQITRKFIQYFGTGLSTEGFVVKYDYSVDDTQSIELSLDKGKIRTAISESFCSQLSSPQFRKLLADLKRYSQSSKPQDALYQDQVRQDIDGVVTDLLGNRQSLFYPAGRSVAVNYPDSVKLTFFGKMAGDLRTASLRRERGTSSQTFDLDLMYEFLQQSERLKERFRNQDFSALIKGRVALNESVNLETLEEAKEKIAKILRGEYSQDSSGEKIYLGDDKYVFLSDASSGQQEVVRLVQDIFLLLLNQENAFRIIEEPEAHLWPMAQKHLVELMIMMLNQTNSQLMITTHSPYVLSVFNNLLYAYHVMTVNPSVEHEIAQIIPKICWLNPQTFSAYMLKDGYCQSILNKELGLIGQNFLDQISETLSDEFDKMYSLHAKVYA